MLQLPLAQHKLNKFLHIHCVYFSLLSVHLVDLTSSFSFVSGKAKEAADSSVLFVEEPSFVLHPVITVTSMASINAIEMICFVFI